MRPNLILRAVPMWPALTLGGCVRKDPRNVFACTLMCLYVLSLI